MPYFIEEREGQFCVMKGTKEDPQGTEKCHDTREKATAHLKALYVNVEDAKSLPEELKANAGVNSTDNLPHGIGSPLGGATGDGKARCVCPKCGRTVAKTAELCKMQQCPACDVAMYEMEDDEVEEKAQPMKSETDGKHPAAHYLVVENPQQPSTWHLRVRDSSGKPDHGLMGGAWAALHGGYRGNKYEGPNKEEALSKLSALYKAENLPTPGDSSKFVSYKAADGTWRWMAISSIALEDKEKEIVSEKAYDDAIRFAREKNVFGELDIVHVDGTEVGDCDMMARLNFQLIEGGTWRTTPLASRTREKIAEDPERWGVSLKFRYDPAQFDGKTYRGGIQILKRSVLPRNMAASYGTAIAVLGGEKMMAISEEAKAVLKELGVEDNQIAELAEKQKGVELHIKLKDKIASFFADLRGEPQTAVLEAVEGKEVSLATTPVEVPKQVEPVVEKVETPVADAPTAHADVKTAEQLGQATATLIVPIMEKAIREAVQPLQAEIVALQTRLIQAEKSVEDRVVEKLAAMPPVTKVAPTMVAPVDTSTVIQKQDTPPSEAKMFVEAVADLVKKAYASGELKLQV